MRPAPTGVDADVRHGAAPVMTDTLARDFIKNLSGQRLGIAVSGGGDSLALLITCLAWAKEFDVALAVATVDHGLRPESLTEALTVGKICRDKQIPHDILNWANPPVPGKRASGNLMDQARKARLQLLTEWARKGAMAHVALGHTADDQAETLLMNLARGTGLDGLTGLRPVFMNDGVTFHRPLLSATRSDLRQVLRQADLTWSDDPTNENPRFTRARTREALRHLAVLGITAQGLAQTARNLATAQDALKITLSEWVKSHLKQSLGAVEFDHSAYLALPEELQRRLLIAIIKWMTGAPHPPTETKLTHLRDCLGTGTKTTLSGLCFSQNAGQIRILREPRAAMGAVPFGTAWDHRWQIAGPGQSGDVIRALGIDGLAFCPNARRVARRDVLLVSPSLWRDGKLVSAPFAQIGTDFTVVLSPSLWQNILSH